MLAPRSRFLFLTSLVCMLGTVPAAAVADRAAQDKQSITVRDSRTGTGPCGFAVRRDIAGTVAVTPSLDDAGNLALAIAPVTLRGSLVNPANGKSVELKWVKQNGKARFEADGSTTAITLALTGHVFPGYDDARIDLSMSLPVEGTASFAFQPDERAEETWVRVCELLA